MGIKCKAILDAARGQPCLIEIAGTCNHDQSTVVSCHLPPRGTSGMSIKGSDTWVAFGCSACHSALDSRSGSIKRFGEDWLFYSFRGVYRTQLVLAEMGLLRLGKK